MQKEIRQQITEFAKGQGFDLVGFSKTKIEKEFLEGYDNWLKNGNEGEMEYMKKIEPRKDLTKILPGAKSVIVLAMNYYNEQKPLKKGFGRVARYAHGRDYHKILKKKLIAIEKFIKTLKPRALTKSYVDTGPVLERGLAVQAGLGHTGKNSCLITKDFGSWVLLAEIITTLQLAETTEGEGESEHGGSEKIVCGSVRRQKAGMDPALRESLADAQAGISSRGKSPVSSSNNFSRNSDSTPFPLCGSCTRCMNACPTGAIIAPGVIDARKCISYLTIEHKGKIPPALATTIKATGRIFGCDICQEVCPHNIAKQKPTTSKDLTIPKIAGDQISLKKILSLKSQDQFIKTFAGSPLTRPKLPALHRNAKIVSTQIF